MDVVKTLTQSVSFRIEGSHVDSFVPNLDVCSIIIFQCQELKFFPSNDGLEFVTHCHFSDSCTVGLVDCALGNSEECIVVEEGEETIVLFYRENVVDESFSEGKVSGQNVHIWELE